MMIKILPVVLYGATLLLYSSMEVLRARGENAPTLKVGALYPFFRWR